MTVKFFSHLRTITGCNETKLSFQKTVSSEELWTTLAANFPGLHSMRSTVRIAKNHEYVGADSTFDDDDEIALIPPVSGG